MEEDKSRYIIAIGSDEVIINRETADDDPGSTKNRSEVMDFLRELGVEEDGLRYAGILLDEETGFSLDVSWKGK